MSFSINVVFRDVAIRGLAVVYAGKYLDRTRAIPRSFLIP